MILSVRDMGRWAAPLLAGVLLATSAAVPHLDGRTRSPAPTIETEHHPGACHAGHDHRICTLVGASQWIAVGDARRPDGPRPLYRLGTVPLPAPALSLAPALQRSRSPPVA